MISPSFQSLSTSPSYIFFIMHWRTCSSSSFLFYLLQRMAWVAASVKDGGTFTQIFILYNILYIIIFILYIYFISRMVAPLHKYVIILSHGIFWRRNIFQLLSRSQQWQYIGCCVGDIYLILSHSNHQQQLNLSLTAFSCKLFFGSTFS